MSANSKVSSVIEERFDASCDARDIAVKSFFLGPQAENGEWFKGLVDEMLSRWLEWRQGVFPEDGYAISPHDQKDASFKERQESFRRLATELSKRFESEIPKFSPRYMGHMFSEISLPALIGHWIATLHNPNNISTESAPVGVEVEREAVAELAKMAGFGAEACGHFTSCGSIANFEALLRARDRVQADDPDAKGILFVPDNKHYSWIKAAHVLGIGQRNLRTIALDRRGVLDVENLRVQMQSAISSGERILMVVSVLGSTELGNFDPVGDVQNLIDEISTRERPIWHHVDGAYGGFFLPLKEETEEPVFEARSRNALSAVARVSSITIDPHKLGYVPYACGAFICRAPEFYTTRVFDSPYIQFPTKWEPGPFTLEGSRSASGAAATWLTLKAIGSDADGYGRIVRRTVQLRKELSRLLSASDERIRVVPHLQTNVLCFTVGANAQSLTESNRWVKAFYEAHSGPKAKYSVSKTSLPIAKYESLMAEMFGDWKPQVDCESIDLVRLTLMNPFLRSKEMKTQVLQDFCNEVIRAL